MFILVACRLGSALTHFPYPYTYVPIYPYTYAHIHPYTQYTHIHLYTHIYPHTQIPTHLYTPTHLPTSTHLHTYTPTHLYTYTPIHTHTRTHTHTHTQGAPLLPHADHHGASSSSTRDQRRIRAGETLFEPQVRGTPIYLYSYTPIIYLCTYTTYVSIPNIPVVVCVCGLCSSTLLTLPPMYLYTHTHLYTYVPIHIHTYLHTHTQHQSGRQGDFLPSRDGHRGHRRTRAGCVFYDRYYICLLITFYYSISVF
jgi:hypothetical protein